MNPHFIKSLSMLIAIAIWQNGFSQTTYTISASTSWSSLSPSPSWCTGCTFNISTGKTLTLNSSTGCVNCVFNGGIVVDNVNMSFQGGTFNVDSMAVNNASTSFQVSSTQGPTFKNGVLELLYGITIQGGTFSSETVRADMPTTSTLTLQAAGSFTTTTMTNTTFIGNTGSLFLNAATSITNSTLSLNSIKVTANTGQLALSNSTLMLNGSANLTMTSTPMTLSNNSEIIVGDVSTSTAFLYMNNGANGVQINDNSLIKVTGNNNYYQNNAAYKYTSSGGSSTSYSTMVNSLNCGTATTNACKTNYVYGCATLNSAGAQACATLAIAAPVLSAQASGPGTVILSWAGNDNAAQYQLQRSSNGYDWQTIDLVALNVYNNDNYQYADASAPAGTSYYRLLQTDKDGRIAYSAIVTANVEPAVSKVSLFPNPAINRTFHVKASTTAPLLLNAYSLSGQLLFRSSLKGQLLYTIDVPNIVNTGDYIVIKVLSSEGSSVFTLLNK